MLEGKAPLEGEAPSEPLLTPSPWYSGERAGERGGRFCSRKTASRAKTPPPPSQPQLKLRPHHEFPVSRIGQIIQSRRRRRPVGQVIKIERHLGMVPRLAAIHQKPVHPYANLVE